MEDQRIFAAMGLAASLVYGYCIHMRTIGVVIACVLACFFWVIKGEGRKRSLLVWFCVLIILRFVYLDKFIS